MSVVCRRRAPPTPPCPPQVGIFLVYCGKLTTCLPGGCDKIDDVIGAYIWGGSSLVAFLGMVICFIAGAVMLPSSILVSDVCVVMEGLAPNMVAYIPEKVKLELKEQSLLAQSGLAFTGSVATIAAEAKLAMAAPTSRRTLLATLRQR